MAEPTDPKSADPKPADAASPSLPNRPAASPAGGPTAAAAPPPSAVPVAASPAPELVPVVVAPPPPTLGDKLGVAFSMRTEFDGIETVVVAPADFATAALALRDTAGFARFVDVFAIDRVESGREDRFEVQLMVYSMSEKRHARLTTHTVEKMPSVTGVYEAAHNYEREVYDLMGVVFEGHPKLTRIMMPDGWIGHPQRRDAEAPYEQVDFTVTRALYNT